MMYFVATYYFFKKDYFETFSLPNLNTPKEVSLFTVFSVITTFSTKGKVRITFSLLLSDNQR